jgi:shikimate dehydrogenase
MRTFGLIGFPLSHSFSRTYFAEKFARENITNSQYLNFPLESIDAFPSLLQSHPDIKGLNVTIPYKESVLPFLDEVSDTVKKIGACNCIAINAGEKIGHNTDEYGFRISLEKKLKPFHKKALILGEGGAAKAVAYSLEKLGIDFLFVVRKNADRPGRIHYDQLTDSIIADHLLIINCTPLGMYPNLQEAPPINYEAISSRHYFFDLIYNPAKTLFLQRGEEKGAVIENGHEMLILQAEESWKIWNSF